MSHLVKNLVERADKDKDGKIQIDEILAFDDFEFVELAHNVFVELGNPGERLSYLVKHKVLGTLPNYSIFTSSASRTSHQLHYGVALFLLNLYLCTFQSCAIVHHYFRRQVEDVGEGAAGRSLKPWLQPGSPPCRWSSRILLVEYGTFKVLSRLIFCVCTSF